MLSIDMQMTGKSASEISDGYAQTTGSSLFR
jgi:hypothetical protein